MTLRPLRALREINASISELERADVRAREVARMDLARSASAYSRKAREVVDGTMSLSAVLVRAGEVGEAERLLAEAERDVRQEKETLLESVQEVKIATRRRREKMTRLRLAKTLATAFLGGSVFVFSAVGLVAAKYFGEILPSSPRASAGTEEVGRYEVSPARRISLALGGMELELSPEQYEEFQRLVSSADPDRLRTFLLGIIPSNLAGKLDRALADAGIATSPQLAALEATAGDVVQEARRVTAPKSASSSETSQNPETKPSNNQKQDDGSSDDDPSSGSSGCDEEGEGEEENGLSIGPLQGCLPFIDNDDSGG